MNQAEKEAEKTCLCRKLNECLAWILMTGSHLSLLPILNDRKGFSMLILRAARHWVVITIPAMRMFYLSFPFEMEHQLIYLVFPWLLILSTYLFRLVPTSAFNYLTG